MMLKVTSLNINEVTHEVEELIKERLPLRFLKSSKITNKIPYLESVGAAKLLLDAFPNIQEDDLTFNEYGKPSFKNQKMFFNISHSKGQIVLAVSDKNVGIDIEKIDKNRIKNPSRIFPNIRLENDIDALKLWTVKEAYVKCLGVSSFDKNLDIDSIKLFKEKLLTKNNHEYELIESNKTEGFYCSIVIQNR